MKKKVILISSILIIFLGLIGIICFNEIPRIVYKYDQELRGYIITNVKGHQEVVEIPTYYKDEPVLGIARESLSNNETLKEVSFASDSLLEFIGEGSFSNCVNLEKINFPSSLVKIEQGAFIGCSSLQKVVFAKEANLKIVSGSSFFDCVNLKEVILPINLKSIGSYAFYNTNIERFEVSRSTNLYDNALDGVTCEITYY